MKLYNYIALGSVMALSLTSCNDWLDVNVNPNQPNHETIKVENRLPGFRKSSLIVPVVPTPVHLPPVADSIPLTPI